MNRRIGMYSAVIHLCAAVGFVLSLILGTSFGNYLFSIFLSAFFTGLTIKGASKRERSLKCLLLIHGVFFISSFLIPLLGLFSADARQSTMIGPIIQSFWCLYFSFIDVLSFGYFKNKIDA